MRENFACRACDTIIQPPAPFHPIARGRAGPELLATILDAKFAQHLPLNRQSEMFSREGIELDTSTLADWVGACTATLSPLVTLIRAHVLAAERLHGDDTTVPVLAKGKTKTGRLWATCATTGRSPDRPRPRRCSSTRPTAGASTRSGTSPPMPGFCICLSNTAAERALRGVALGRKAWLFAGSDRGGERAAAIYTLIITAKLNGVDPRAWLADVLRRIPGHPAARLHELLRWNWNSPTHTQTR